MAAPVHINRYHLPSVFWLSFLSALAGAWAVTWEPVIYPDNKIFPSYAVSTATVEVPDDVLAKWDMKHVGDENGMIGVLLSDVPKGTKYRVEIVENAIMEGSVLSGTIPKKGDEWLILPRVPYKYPALLRQAQPIPVNITFRVSLDGQPAEDKTVTADVRSLNECLMAVLQDDESEPVDYSWLFAAYVNENHPLIDGILREALDLGELKSFDGYQSGDRAVVRAQVKAIWDVLQKRGFRYSDITTTDSESEKVNSQYVRFFDDAIKSRSANCVDGTVLMASILRRIGLSVSLALLPTHMFLVVEMDDEGKRRIGVETTLMGEESKRENNNKPKARPAAKRGGFFQPDESSDQDAPEAEDEAAADGDGSFANAVEVGTAELKENLAKFEDSESMDYQLIDVSDARRLGIRPIAPLSSP